MKKIICFILVMMLCVTVSADVTDDFKELMQSLPENAQFSANVSISDEKGVLEAYFDGKAYFDGRTVRMYADVLSRGENIQLWAEADIPGGLGYNVIMCYPGMDKYIIADYSKIPGINSSLSVGEAEDGMVMVAETDENGECTGVEIKNDIFSADCKIKKTAELQEIVFPEITDENSADITAMLVEGIKPYEVNMLYNDGLIKFEEKPIVEGGRTYLPVRKIVNTFGISDNDISFDGANRMVTVKYGENEMLLIVGSNVAYINGEPEELDAPAFIRYDRTYLPLRFIAESFGKKVDWLPVEDTEGKKLSGSLIIMTDE